MYIAFQILFYILINAVILFFLMFDPIADGSEKALIRATYPLISNLFYDKQKENSLLRQDDILILTIDDKELEISKKTYPLKLEEHVSTLESISIYQPKAIFIDLVFIDTRESVNEIENFVNEICRLSNNTKIYIGSILTEKKVGNKDRVILDQLVEYSHLQKSNRPCFTEVNVALDLKKVDESEWYYPIGKSNEVGTYLASASTQIYNDFIAKRESELFVSGDTTSMSVIWGSRPSPLIHDVQMSQYGELKCRSKLTPFEAFKEMPIISLFIDSSEQLPCKFFPELRPSSLKFYFDAGTSKSEEILIRLIKNKYIFYGIDLIGAPDRVVSPIHGEVSGATLHAMALHNLATFGQQYIPKSELNFNSWEFILNDDFWIFFALISALTISAYILRKGAKIFLLKESGNDCDYINIFFDFISKSTALIVLPLEESQINYNYRSLGKMSWSINMWKSLSLPAVLGLISTILLYSANLLDSFLKPWFLIFSSLFLMLLWVEKFYPIHYVIIKQTIRTFLYCLFYILYAYSVVLVLTFVIAALITLFSPMEPLLLIEIVGIVFFLMVVGGSQFFLDSFLKKSVEIQEFSEKKNL